ncbi:MAG TPA: DNA-binding transcriptional regulator, partial [Eubacteriaceae bacterium]|nr:DNA-binding transcriptional regulator [Eubacteriaceae bacterium]
MKKNELVNIARLYYEKKQTQQKIANQLGISRMAVSRALAKCEEEGIVEIKIHLQDSYLDLEQRIAEKYALKEVHIVPYDENEQTLYQMLGEKALEILENKLASDSKVGIGWGATLNALKNVAAAQNPRKIGSTFIPLLGGYGNADSEFHANQIASSLATAFGGHSLQ